MSDKISFATNYVPTAFQKSLDTAVATAPTSARSRPAAAKPVSEGRLGEVVAAILIARRDY